MKMRGAVGAIALVPFKVNPPDYLAIACGSLICVLAELQVELVSIEN
jgi:hypothetical protein